MYFVILDNTVHHDFLCGYSGDLNQTLNMVKRMVPSMDNKKFGISISEGIALGPAHIMAEDLSCVVKTTIAIDNIEHELARYHEAHRWVSDYYRAAIDEAERELSDNEVAILKSHQMLLNDPYFADEIPQLISENHLNAEWLVLEGVRRMTDTLGQSTDPYLRERVADVQDIGKQLVHYLLDLDLEEQIPSDRGVIVISREVVPSDIVRLKKSGIKALVTDRGTQTSHAAIMARSLGIPVVMGTRGLSRIVKNGDIIFVNGYDGLVHINPDESTLYGYRNLMEDEENRKSRKQALASEPAITLDGRRIRLVANLVDSSETNAAHNAGAEGVGLFRSEISFLASGRLLSEDEQYEIYRSVVLGMNGAPVVIRTLDLGGDKLIPFMDHDHEPESNPFLGWRSVRISLYHKDVFKVQLRAIIRASMHGPVKVMFPMISTVDELRDANSILDEVMNELYPEPQKHHGGLERGIMIEVPAAAVLIDALLPHVDFISIGTNDLIQYTLAVDRNNPRVSSYYRPADPAVIRLIRRTTRWAARLGKPVSVCGEVAGQTRFTPLLVGLGISELSMAPGLIPEVKHIIKHMRYEDTVKMARHALRCAEAMQVDEMLEDFISDIPAI